MKQALFEVMFSKRLITEPLLVNLFLASKVENLSGNSVFYFSGGERFRYQTMNLGAH